MNKSNGSLTCLMWLVVIVVGIIMTIVQGWVLTMLWGWFIVPTFKVAQLSIAVAIGIAFIVSMFRSATQTSKGETLEEKIGNVLGAILSPFITLLLGYIVHLFM